MLGTILNKTYRFLASYGFATILLLLLLLLTYLGTLEQVDQGLYEVQKKYFESIFLVHHFGVVPVVLPGVYLLLVLLFVNLLIGGIVRLRRSWSRVGLYVAHFGILFLLVAGFVSFRWAVHGHVKLHEGEGTDEFVSDHDWEIAVYRAGQENGATEHLVSWREFRGIGSGDFRTFTSDALPFDLVATRFIPHCVPVLAGPGKPGAVDGVLLEEREKRKESETNIPGARVTIRDKSTGRTTEGLLWGHDEARPLPVVVADDVWAVKLRKARRNLPFAIVLDKFTRVLHPGTNMPKSFMSDVTKIEDGVRQPVNVRMNEPLRRKGFTLYQSQWGQESGGRLYSVFAVAQNPADQWPLIACLIISAGLLFHFSLKLVRYLVAEAEKRS
ncbi:MAG: cytochrome c biogenesis protein ResB [Planctomycetota bacterium]|jgi:hypothetical protein